MLSMLCAHGIACKKNRPDPTPETVVKDPLSPIPEEVREIIASERAMLVIKLDPVAYKSLHRPLGEKLAPFMSWLPMQGSWFQEDIWAGLATLDERLDTSAISRELPAYLIMGLGRGESFEACVEALLPCPPEALHEVDTFTLLLPTSSFEALEASVQDFIPKPLHRTRRLGERYVQVDINERWEEAGELIDYQRSPRRQVTAAAVETLASPGAFSLWMNGKTPSYLGAAISWGQIYSALASATPEMRAKLTAHGSGVIDQAMLVRNPALHEYHDFGLTVRAAQKKAHLDLVMSRTEVGAKIAVAADRDAEAAKIRVPNAFIEAEIDYDLGEALRVAPRDDREDILTAMSYGGPLASLQMSMRPTSTLRALARQVPESAILTTARGMRLAFSPDVDYARSSPIGMPGLFAFSLQTYEEDVDWLQQLEGAPASAKLTVKRVREREDDLILGISGGTFPASPVGEVTKLERTRIAWHMEQLPEMGEAMGMRSSLELAILDVFSRLGLIELVSTSTPAALRWRVTFGEHVPPEKGWEPAKLSQAEPWCARAELFELNVALSGAGMASPEAMETLLEQRERALKAALEATEACTLARGYNERSVALQVGALEYQVALFAEDASFEEARTSACAKGLTVYCDEAVAKKQREEWSRIVPAANEPTDEK
jgi:hypothetical protein